MPRTGYGGAPRTDRPALTAEQIEQITALATEAISSLITDLADGLRLELDVMNGSDAKFIIEHGEQFQGELQEVVRGMIAKFVPGIHGPMVSLEPARYGDPISDEPGEPFNMYQLEFAACPLPDENKADIDILEKLREVEAFGNHDFSFLAAWWPNVIPAEQRDKVILLPRTVYQERISGQNETMVSALHWDGRKWKRYQERLFNICLNPGSYVYIKKPSANGPRT